jgi:hypothetical protein
VANIGVGGWDMVEAMGSGTGGLMVDMAVCAIVHQVLSVILTVMVGPVWLLSTVLATVMWHCYTVLLNAEWGSSEQ